MSETTLVGVRVHSWQWFKLRKWAELQSLPLGQALTEAIKEFLATQGIPDSEISKWLTEYHAESPHEVD